MRLYFNPLSACARRVRMTIVALGIADRIELVNVELGAGEQRKPDFLRRNPNGRVPVLEDDGFVLWESHAIMQYLAEGQPGQTLYPSERRARADVNRWLFWNANHFAPAVSILNWERMVKRFLGAGEPDPVEVARGEKLFSQFAGVLDAHLAGKEWIAEGRLTLADLAISSQLMSIVPAKLPVSELPHLQAWFERVRALEAWKKTDV
jgi:glutathione S-transferase